ncbi:MAG: YbaB/EbfC family nucleoid-associated protein [Gemmataceae bacterium]
MFKELGQIAGLMKQLPKIKEEMERFQQQLGQIQAEGDAGAGMVRVRVNGRMEILSCAISPETLADREMLEDLIRAATNQAITKVRQQVAEESAKMATNLGLPMGGLGLPGLGG